MRQNTKGCLAWYGVWILAAAVAGCSGGVAATPDGTGDGPDGVGPETGDVTPDGSDAEATACTEGETQCSPDGRRQTCASDGTWTLDPCPDGTACVDAGVCAAVICLAGDHRCDPDDVRRLQDCNPTGTAWEDGDECPDGQVCEFGACTATVCTPGETTCTGDGQVRTCNATGTGFGVPEDCPDGEACDGTACRPIICTVGETECADRDTVRTCNTLGTAWVSADCPDGQACDGGTCLVIICTPSAHRCDPTDPLATQDCNLVGTEWLPPVDCPDGQGCADGLCRTQICAPAATACAVGGLIQTCDPSGTEWSVAVPCPGGEACDIGVCVPVICTPGGDATCLDTATRRVCNDVGTAFVDLPCSDGYVCQTDACVLQICPPGLTLCATSTTLERCNALGTAFEPAGICNAATGERCYMGTCQTLCQQAEMADSSVGCVFYGVDLDQYDGGEDGPYAIIVSNTHASLSATVTVEDRRGAGGTWRTRLGPQTIGPNTLYTFRLPSDQHVEDTGRQPGYAYRVTSNIPVIAYQFNPIDSAGQYSNDASLLLPKNTLDGTNYIASWKMAENSAYTPPNTRGYITVVGAQDGTSVTIRVTATTLLGGGIPAVSSGGTYTTTVNEGEVIQLTTASRDTDLTGSLVTATAPVAVFGGHECALVPQSCGWCRTAIGGGLPDTYATDTCLWCDHIEEQMFPVNTWGMNYIAARTPVRSTSGRVEAAYWRVLGSVDSTTVTITTMPGISLRFPPGVTPPYRINAGQYLEFEMAGTTSAPGDALIGADHPIMVVQYIEGQECTNVGAGSGGDPAMILMVPVEQYLDRYIFLTPSTYTSNFVDVIRQTGSTVTLDGSAVGSFIDVATGYQVARPTVAPGVHSISGTASFGIIGVGYAPYVSYGYMGGLRLQVINPL